MTNEGSTTRTPAAWRAWARSLRARGTTRVGPRAVAVGALVGIGAIAAKMALGELTGGDTGYILLVAAVILAAWIGGVAAGAATTICCLALDSIVFLPPGAGLVAEDPAGVWKQVLFLVTGIVASAIVGSTRAARDKLVAALEDVSTMAEEIESRDHRLEMMLAASGHRVLGMGHRDRESRPGPMRSSASTAWSLPR